MHIGSIVFTYWFLPVFLLIYYVIPSRFRLLWLAAGSLVFYGWGSLLQLAALAAVCLVTFGSGLLSKKSGSKVMTGLGIAFNIAFLACCKYLSILPLVPAGISFIVFHNISWLADLRSDETLPLSFRDYFVYITMFPKLEMGPIAGFKGLWQQFDGIRNGSIGLDPAALSGGAFRFSVGLAKKAVLAGKLGEISAALWADAPDSQISAWLGLITFALELYYDFSGYSDMAIGMCRMMGLELPENFNYPYISCSVSEFWRRWHISLGSFFRNYVYIPLGGSRCSLPRNLFNLMAVWILTGIWHGSGLNFAAWGLGLGLVICIERLLGFEKNVKGFWGWLWSTFFVLMGWVLFNSADLPSALEYFGWLFTGPALRTTHALTGCLHDNWIYLVMGLAGAVPAVSDSSRALMEKLPRSMAVLLRCLTLLGLLSIATLYLVNSGYSAFLYFNF